jgi:hypothetical protein
MLTTLAQVIDELRGGQLTEHRHSNIELKEDWAQSHGEKLSALANKTGQSDSWFIVGVTDTGQLVGKQEKWAKAREEVISQHVNENLDPIQACKGITCYEINSAWIILICVRNPGEVVYWDKYAYTGSGTTTRVMEPDEILKLRITLPGLTDFSSQNISSTYDQALLQMFTSRVMSKGATIESPSESRLGDQEVLQKLGIADRQTSRILFGGCTYRVIKYDKLERPVENSTRTGLYGLLRDDFLTEIQRWTGEEVATPEPYPQRALKETLANAVAHAAYFENDGEVILELFPNHLSIGNLCLRESAYFANRWFSRSHKTVNGLLMEVLRVAGHVDELGRGKNLIYSESIKNGKRPPEVFLERAGRYDHWRLVLYAGEASHLELRLLERIRAIYSDQQKALIAHALVLWRDKPVSEISNYIDGDFSRQFAEVLASLDGATFYWKAQDRIVLARWASVLLGEGKDSKTFSPAEEEQLRSLAYEIRTKYYGGHITPKDLRRLAHMGNTASEKSLSSKLLSKWASESFVTRLGKGKFQFVNQMAPSLPDFSEFLKRFQQNIQS